MPRAASADARPVRAIVTSGHRDDPGARLDPDRPDPTPEPGEVQIRPARCLVTAADAAVAHAGVFAGVLGQSFVGTVEAVGSRDDAGLIGSRVTCAADLACGSCDRCKRGLSAHCERMTVMGERDRDGCLADLVCVPKAALLPVPKSVSDDAAVFARPLAAALHAAGMVRLEGKGFVTVLGDGPMALLCSLVMTRLNATVRLLATRPDPLGLCEKWGVKHRHRDEAGRRQDQDVVIDCTGTGEGFTIATRMVRPRGSVVLTPARTPGIDPAAVLSPVIQHELQIVGARSGVLRDAMHELESGSYDPTPLISKRMKLADGAAVIDAAGDPAQLAVSVEP